MRKIAYFLALCCINNSSYAQSNEERVTQAKELIRSMCLVGSGYEMSIGANGEISISKLGADGEVKFSKRELEGVVDVPDPDKHEELNSIRECTKPYIPRLLDILLKDVGAVNIRERGTSEALIRSKYLTKDEMESKGCTQAEQSAIEKARTHCSSNLYEVKLVSCKPTGRGNVTAYSAVIEGKCKENA